MTSISKNVSIDKSDDIVNKYNNKYQRTIKMNSVDVKSSKYFDFNVENNDTDPKFEFVRRLRYKSIFAKGYTPYWSEEVFVIKKANYTVP